MFAEFRVAGQFKSFLNYFLLDPRTLETGSTSETLKQFQHFVESIFYVGKGKNARCYQHLKDARTQDRKTKASNCFKKKILSCFYSQLKLKEFLISGNLGWELSLCTFLMVLLQVKLIAEKLQSFKLLVS